jgi:hypothetical protein
MEFNGVVRISRYRRLLRRHPLWEMPLHGERFLIHGPREIHDIVAKQNKFALDTIA